MLTLYRSALTALISMLLLSAAVFSNVNDDDVPEVTARVARISFVTGDVKVRRSGEDEWETADLNLPLVEGDELHPGQVAHQLAFELADDPGQRSLRPRLLQRAHQRHDMGDVADGGRAQQADRGRCIHREGRRPGQPGRSARLLG